MADLSLPSSQAQQAAGFEVTPQALPDPPSVRADGTLLDQVDGVVFVPLRPHVDHRGSLTEVVSFAHPFWSEPIVHAYCFTILPGRIKGWGMHKLQSDRYYLASGSVRVVLYDGRTLSPTYGRYAEYHLSKATPGLLLIPPGVWHADQNWGGAEAHMMNFPTRAFDHRAPDKYRIDPHSGEIPFDWSLRDG